MMPDRSAPERKTAPLPPTVEESVTTAPRPDAQDTVPTISAEDSTALLRRCTALATRARVELLGPGRRSVEELQQLLGDMARWDDAALVDPDPTMMVLAAAALQDLAERLDGPHSTELTARIDAVVGRLRAEMGTGAVDPAVQGASALGVSA